MTKAERYVRKYLPLQLEEVLALPIAEVQNGLSPYEKTLIYHYTKDGYASINQWLRSPGRVRETTRYLYVVEKRTEEIARCAWCRFQDSQS